MIRQEEVLDLPGTVRSAQQLRRLQDGPPSDRLTWQSLSDLLYLVGDHRSQLNGLRLYLPLELRRSLGEILLEQWIISPWIECCLRVVPAVLWNDYHRVSSASVL